jgi:hypothetical protein
LVDFIPLADFICKKENLFLRQAYRPADLEAWDLKAKSLLGTCLNTSSTFYAIGIFKYFVYRELHGANPLAFAALYALILVYFECILVSF